MARYRSLNHQVAGLRQGQLVTILECNGEITISGCNDFAAQTVRDALYYVPYNGGIRLRVRPDSLAARSGAQFRYTGGK